MIPRLVIGLIGANFAVPICSTVHPARHMSAGPRMMWAVDYDLGGLGPTGFQRLCQALAIAVLGTDVQAFGMGPDGGRDATFNGNLRFPSPEDGWNGYGVLQAKFRQRGADRTSDLAWLRRHIKKELDAWADPNGSRQTGRVPEFLIVATNAELSSGNGGGKDAIDKLIAGYAPQLGLKSWRVWDADQLRALLDAHQDIAGSAAALITPNIVMAKLLDELRGGPGLRNRIALAEGLPDVEAEFHRAFTEAGGAQALGDPTGPAYLHDLGAIQHFRRADGQESTICALHNRPATVVPAAAWRAITSVGNPSPGGGLAGVGFPVPAPGAQAGRPDPRCVHLAGGRWGPGTLIRKHTGDWSWRPEIRRDMNAAADRTVWTGAKTDLRIRVAARLPWLLHGHRIDSVRRRLTLDALHAPATTQPLLELARRRGASNTKASWALAGERDGRNDTSALSYLCELAGPDGRPAITGRASLHLPTTPQDGSTLAVADICIDFAACDPHAEPNSVAPEHRVTIDEIVTALAWGWTCASRTLPLAIDADPAGLIPIGAPRFGLHVLNEVADNLGGPRTLQLGQMVNLDGFGHTTKTNLNELSTAVTAPVDLTDPEIDDVIKAALTGMAEDYGFIDADLAFG